MDVMIRLEEVPRMVNGKSEIALWLCTLHQSGAVYALETSGICRP